MDKIAEIKKKLQEVVGANPNFPIVGTVEALDGETCSVKLVSGLVLSGVKISASVTESEDYLLLEPVVGSDVLMLSGDGTLSNLYLIKVDQIGKFKFSQSGMKIEFDSVDKKIKIENGTVNLKDLFTDLATILNSLKVGVVAVGAPSGTITPDVVALVTSFSTKINTLLK
ncbi:hypothetical protein [Flavobacterium sp. AED]|uniref:hypothetical protein n=1 Tax=Flavobacterium sp. AED TaxID=1423323 RepID=UPI00057EFBDA|nr:hypothetical protein [Flavobacterium sp. AED]KIA86581.1 hypothetical protein OA85_02700 [Flavobacterium sp. AED]